MTVFFTKNYSDANKLLLLTQSSVVDCYKILDCQQAKEYRMSAEVSEFIGIETIDNTRYEMFFIDGDKENCFKIGHTHHKKANFIPPIIINKSNDFYMRTTSKYPVKLFYRMVKKIK